MKMWSAIELITRRAGSGLKSSKTLNWFQKCQNSAREAPLLGTVVASKKHFICRIITCYLENLGTFNTVSWLQKTLGGIE